MSLENPSSVSPFSRPSIFLLLPAVGRKEGPTPPPQPTSNTHFLNVFAFPYFCSPSLSLLLSPARERIHKIKKKWGESTKGENFSPVSPFPTQAISGDTLFRVLAKEQYQGKPSLNCYFFLLWESACLSATLAFGSRRLGASSFPFTSAMDFQYRSRENEENTLFSTRRYPPQILIVPSSHPLQQTHTIAVFPETRLGFFFKKNQILNSNHTFEQRERHGEEQCPGADLLLVQHGQAVGLGNRVQAAAELVDLFKKKQKI